MSRSLLIAGLTASALHVAVFAGLEAYLVRPGREAGRQEPICLHMTTLAEPSEAPEADQWLDRVSDAPEPLDSTPALDPLAPAEPPEELVEAVSGESAEAMALPEAPEHEPLAMTAAPAPMEPRSAEGSEPLAADMPLAAPMQPAVASPVTMAAPVAVVAEEAAVESHLIEAPPRLLLALLESIAQRAARSQPRPVAAPAPPPRPAATPGQREQPVAEHRPKPRYPAIARRRGYEGEVLLLVEVRSDGGVGAVTVSRSSGHEVLDRAAQETVRERWRFRPGSVDRRPTDFWIEIPIEFRLTDSN